MQLHGQSLGKPAIYTYHLSRGDEEPWTFDLSPLPLGFHTRLRLRGIIPPVPPSKIARDASGKPLRDANGHAVTLTNDTDAEFISKRELYHQRVAVLSVVESLSHDPQVHFDTPAPNDTDHVNWTKYADDIFAELESAGFSCGDLIKICTEICRISNLLDDQLQNTGKNFLSPHPTN